MISIIVSIYKVEKYLVECIDSLLSQDNDDYEIILVDDGSPDCCPDICDKYAQKNKKVKTIHKHNGGLVSSRKAGLEVAVGEYICFVDGDDFVSKLLISTYKGIIDEYNPDVICAGLNHYYQDGSVECRCNVANCGYYDKKQLIEKVYDNLIYVPPFYNFSIFPSVCTKCFRKVLLDSVYKCIPDGISIGEDAAASYAAILKANSIYVTDFKGYYYRQTPNSMTKGYRSGLCKRVDLLLSYFSKLKETESWDAGLQLDMYAYYIMSFAITNEFYYNKKASYREKKNAIIHYYDIGEIQRALSVVKIKKLNERIKVFCLKHRFFFPIYVYYYLKK